MLIVADCICQKSKWVRGCEWDDGISEWITFLSYHDGRLAHPFILVMLLSEPGCRRVMSTPVRPSAVCLSLNDRIVESIYTQGQINFSHSIPCVTVSLSSHTENPSGIFLCEDLTIFRSSNLNLNVQLYFIYRPLNQLRQSVAGRLDCSLHGECWEKCNCLVFVLLFDAVYTAAVIPTPPPAPTLSPWRGPLLCLPRIRHGK